jgi:hypothetical protein
MSYVVLGKELFTLMPLTPLTVISPTSAYYTMHNVTKNIET